MYQKIGKASFFFCQWKAAFHNPLILGPKCPFHFVWLRIFGLLSYEGFFLLATKKTNKTFVVDLPFLLSTPPSIFFLFFLFFFTQNAPFIPLLREKESRLKTKLLKVKETITIIPVIENGIIASDGEFENKA